MKKFALMFAALLLVSSLAWADGPVDLTKQRWNGNGVCYSGFRAGQNPDHGPYPTQAQIAEDLRIVARNWKVIRTYDMGQHVHDILPVIRAEKIDLKVQMGVWMSGRPEDQKRNADEVAEAIKLANEYKDIVVAVSVGNEAMVSWSDHRMSEDALLPYLKIVKASVPQPVTIDDDYLYWKDASPKIVNLVDYISLHSYPAWGGADFDKALNGTIAAIEAVQKAHPNKTIVMGELGWPTYSNDAPQMQPRAGSEERQKIYYKQIVDWAKSHDMTIFFFEAFDEPWKGVNAEGHWGMFSVDRKAKPAIIDLYPELKPTGPTSPSYDDKASEKVKGK